METSTGKVLCVGLTCLDIVNICPVFPMEDSDTRVLSQDWRRGGNASNNCTVLSLLGDKCECFCTMAISPELEFLKNDFTKNSIDFGNCVYHSDCTTPTSVVIINQSNGSRTILHSNKTLPELTMDNFKRINLQHGEYNWIHFEGRPNVNAIYEMIDSVHNWNKSTYNTENNIKISVEIEKVRFNVSQEILMGVADFIFIGKDYAKEVFGANDKIDAVKHAQRFIKEGKSVICGWGSDGAAALDHDGKIYSCQSSSPDLIVDTLGAGDTFIASCIYILNRRATIKTAIEFGCKVAGAKCATNGITGIEIDKIKKEFSL